ncbi:hypothetical protein KQI88_00635 [Alkaliphilus sp. MSJ-5]|uniref:DUF5698 domain-containing protein n=1 Tax=Alkaliphilus flagellatus TaxID=2841507 RepID=A0ABS6FXG0_9FIRM|nr:hypothetical protein [Alkaliphilus flagellatus]
MTKEIIFSLVGLFLITSLTNVLATLKTMLMSKNIMNPVYVLVFIDSMIFATIVSKVTSSNGIHFTISYALGKTAGVIIGGIIEDRLALGILEVDLFLSNKNKMMKIAEKLRIEGYTVNNFRAQGNNEDTRYKVEVVIKRKEFHVFQDILNECGVSNPTLKIKNLSKVNGKITTTRVQTT